MERLYALLAEPSPMLWRQLRIHLPQIIELPVSVPNDEDEEDGNELFKRIDQLTRRDLEAHLGARTEALLCEIRDLQLLGELFARAAAAGCGPDDILFAAIEAQGVRP